MKIGDLLLDINIKGADKTLGTIAETKSGMSGLASMSIEAKAAIVGAFYAVGSLMNSTNMMGTNLANAGAILGTSTEQLQRYQWAAREANVSTDELAGSFKNIQEKMTGVLFQGARPEGFDLIGMRLGKGFTGQQVKEFAERPEKLLQVLQKYAAVEQNIGLRNKALRSFGLSDGMIAALVRGSFSERTLMNAPIMSEQTITALDKGRLAWSRLGTTIDFAFAKFSSKHGGQLVGDITKIVAALARLSDSLTVLADKMKLFEVLTKTVEMSAALIDALSGNSKPLSDKERKKWAEEQIAKSKDSYENSWFRSLTGGSLDSLLIPQTANAQAGNNNVNIINNNNFQHDGKNAAAIGREVGNETKKAGGQIRQYQTN